MSSRTLFAIFAAGAVLAGCGTVGNLLGTNTATAGMGPAQCRAAGARDFLGHEPEAHTIESARAYAGAMRTRVVRPGDVVTRGESDPLRLTVEVNEAGVIRRLRCG